MEDVSVEGVWGWKRLWALLLVARGLLCGRFDFGFFGLVEPEG